MVDLDPDTLRAVARQLDERADGFNQLCKCVPHQVARGLCREIATDLRTQAIRLTQARALASYDTEPPTANDPTVELEVPGYGQ